VAGLAFVVLLLGLVPEVPRALELEVLVLRDELAAEDELTLVAWLVLDLLPLPLGYELPLPPDERAELAPLLEELAEPPPPAEWLDELPPDLLCPRVTGGTATQQQIISKADFKPCRTMSAFVREQLSSSMCINLSSWPYVSAETPAVVPQAFYCFLSNDFYSGNASPSGTGSPGDLSFNGTTPPYGPERTRWIHERSRSIGSVFLPTNGAYQPGSGTAEIGLSDPL
jgi:hypothetical protein